jgi:hypothetical protein
MLERDIFQVRKINTGSTPRVAHRVGKSRHNIPASYQRLFSQQNLLRYNEEIKTIPTTAQKLNKNHKSYHRINGFHSNIPQETTCNKRQISIVLQLSVATSHSTPILIALMTLLSAPQNIP